MPCDNLDRERESVEPPADLRDDSRAFVAELEGRSDRACTLPEEGDRVRAFGMPGFRRPSGAKANSRSPRSLSTARLVRSVIS